MKKQVNTELTAKDYFDYVKSVKHISDDAFLNNFKQVVEDELSKAIAIGQDFMVKRLAFTVGVVPKEKQAVSLGIDTYVLKDDIEYFIQKVADKAVKIIELEFYPRSIPDEIATAVMKLKEAKIFDRFYVLFTDYTGEAQKNVEKTRKERDPIIFGTFEHKIDNIWDIHDRFYYIGDWEDEYCDLTLTKMVDAMSKKGKSIENKVHIPKATPEDVKSYVSALEEIEANRFRLKPIKRTLFQKVKCAFKELMS